MEMLTTREKDCLDFIISFFKTTGCSPKVRDIMRHLKLKSTCSPSIYVKSLEEKGYLKRGGRKQLVREVTMLAMMIPSGVVLTSKERRRK